MTMPLATFSSYFSSTLPTPRPASSSAAFAFSALSPSSSGTANVSTPFETTSVTVESGESSVPPTGSEPMTVPAGIESSKTSCFSGLRPLLSTTSVASENSFPAS